MLKYILLIMEQTAWVSRWFVLKKYIVKMFSVVVHGIYYFTTFVQLFCHDAIDEWYRFFDTICYVSKIIWQKKSNLMIVDNSGIDYSLMLLFVFGFLVYWKIEPYSPAFSRLNYTAVTSKLSKKQTVTSKTTIFKVLLQ